ncbi:hypothetical protein HOY80DRAFT_790936 [Tuber brumale]|nr:hypothetical protein HOY80DRAFT_790936 [Tuber brumale]
MGGWARLAVVCHGCSGVTYHLNFHNLLCHHILWWMKRGSLSLGLARCMDDLGNRREEGGRRKEGKGKSGVWLIEI